MESKKNLRMGFTLVEVLISMVILGIGVLGVVSMLSSAIEGNAESRKMTRALNIAEKELEEFLIDGVCDCSSLENHFFCNSSTNASFPVDHCKITIYWNLLNSQKQIFLETLKYND